jgi:hypothetical protein
MKFDVKAAAKIALAIVKIAVPSVGAVEDAAKQVATLKGDAKKTAAIELVKAGMHAAEDITDKNIVNDPEFDGVLNDLNDVLVRLHKVAGKNQVQ